MPRIPHSSLRHLFIWTALFAFILSSTAMAQECGQPNLPPIHPLESPVWAEEDGLRVAWINFKLITDDTPQQLIDAGVNVLLMAHDMDHLIDPDQGRRDENGSFVFKPRQKFLDRMIAGTHAVAERGIHVIWMASYELPPMQEMLERVGYNTAVVEGPGRYVPAGEYQDAAAMDPVFWREVTGRHGEFIAELSLEHPISGIMYDTEHYDGIMYLQGCGFADVSFAPYLTDRGLTETTEQIPVGTRYDFLADRGLLRDYWNYLEEGAFAHGRYLARRFHAVNPNLILGAWVMYDNWFARGFLRGMGGAIRVIGLSGVEYYDGSDQSRAMADHFQGKDYNLRYLPGFYPPYAYTLEQLQYHVGQAVRNLQGYWMLSPHKQLAQPTYQAVLNTAHVNNIPLTTDQSVSLNYRIQGVDQDAVLVVETTQPVEQFSDVPHLTLRALFGGAALCQDAPMQPARSGVYQLQLPLLRCLTNNRYFDTAFRSGVQYTYAPQPRERLYEDPYHTKLLDGAAYGFCGTTTAWRKVINQAEIHFDLHRPYRIMKVAVSQPTKLEDRYGGPAVMHLDLAPNRDDWGKARPFASDFRLSGSDYAKLPVKGIADKRHGRAWQAWVVDDIDETARSLRIRMSKENPDISLSIGEVAIYGLFEGGLQATVRSGDHMLTIDQGKRYDVTVPRPQPVNPADVKPEW